MSAELMEAIASLTAILDEEDALLATPGRHAALAPLVDAKVRLVGLIDAETTRLGGADWIRGLGDDERAELTGTVAALREKLAANAELLRRRIALCDDVMGAVTAEARRLTGGRSVVYGARGAIARVDQATPIAINTSL